MRGRINSELVVATVLLIWVTIYAVSAVMQEPPFKKDWETTATLWPLILVAIAYPTCLAVLVRAFKEDKEGKRLIPDWKRSRNPIIIVGLTGLYAGIFALVGYWISTFVYCFGLTLLFDLKEPREERRSKVRTLLFSMVVAIVLAGIGYLLYEVIFDIRLPKGIL